MNDIFYTQQVMDTIKRAQIIKDDQITDSYQKKAYNILNRFNWMASHGFYTQDEFQKTEKKININYMKLSLALAENKYSALMKAQTYLENKVARQELTQSTEGLVNELKRTREDIAEIRNEINELKSDIRREDPSLGNQLRLAFIHAKENAIAIGQKCIAKSAEKISDITKYFTKAGSQFILSTKDMISQAYLNTEKCITDSHLRLENFNHKVLTSLRDGIDRRLIERSDRRIARLEQLQNDIDRSLGRDKDIQYSPMLQSTEENYMKTAEQYMKVADQEEIKVEKYADSCVQRSVVEEIPKEILVDEDIDEPIWEMPDYDSPFKYGIGETLASEIVPEENVPVSDRQWDEFLSKVQSSVPEVAEKYDAPEKLNLNDFRKEGMIDPNATLRAAKEKTEALRHDAAKKSPSREFSQKSDR